MEVAAILMDPVTPPLRERQQHSPIRSRQEGGDASKPQSSSPIRYNTKRGERGGKCVGMLTLGRNKHSISCPSIKGGPLGQVDFDLDHVYMYGSNAQDVYTTHIPSLIQEVLEGGRALVVVHGDDPVRYQLVEGDRANDYLGLVTHSSRGLFASLARNDLSSDYVLKLSWCRMDPLHGDIMSDRLKALDSSRYYPSPLLGNPRIMLKDHEIGQQGQGLMISGLIERELQSPTDVQDIFRSIYRQEEQFEVGYNHTFLTITVKQRENGVIWGCLQFVILGHISNSKKEDQPAITYSEDAHGLKPTAWFRSLENVVQMLAAGHPSPPFHVSRLSLLLRGALLGRNHSVFISAIDPLNEPLCLLSLRFAQQLKDLRENRQAVEDLKVSSPDQDDLVEDQAEEAGEGQAKEAWVEERTQESVYSPSHHQQQQQACGNHQGEEDTVNILPEPPPFLLSASTTSSGPTIDQTSTPKRFAPPHRQQSDGDKQKRPPWASSTVVGSREEERVTPLIGAGSRKEEGVARQRTASSLSCSSSFFTVSSLTRLRRHRPTQNDCTATLAHQQGQQGGTLLQNGTNTLSKSSSLRQQITALTNENEVLRLELEELQARVQTANVPLYASERERLKKAMAEAAEFKMYRQVMDAAVSRMHAEVKCLRGAKEEAAKAMEKKAESMRQDKASNQRAAMTVTALRRAVSELEKANAEIEEESQACVRKMEKEVEALRKGIHAMTRERDQALKNVEEAKENMGHEKEEARKVVEGLQQEIEELKRSYAFHGGRSGLEKRRMQMEYVERLEKEAEQTSHELASARREINRLENELSLIRSLSSISSSSQLKTSAHIADPPINTTTAAKSPSPRPQPSPMRKINNNTSLQSTVRVGNERNQAKRDAFAQALMLQLKSKRDEIKALSSAFSSSSLSLRKSADKRGQVRSSQQQRQQQQRQQLPSQHKLDTLAAISLADIYHSSW